MLVFWPILGFNRLVLWPSNVILLKSLPAYLTLLGTLRPCLIIQFRQALRLFIFFVVSAIVRDDISARSIIRWLFHVRSRANLAWDYPFSLVNPYFVILDPVILSFSVLWRRYYWWKLLHHLDVETFIHFSRRTWFVLCWWRLLLSSLLFIAWLLRSLAEVSPTAATVSADVFSLSI